MKKVIATTVITALVVTSLSVGVMAKRRDHGRYRQQYAKNYQIKNRNHNFRENSLTFEQQKQILKIRRDFQKDIITLRFELQENRLDLKVLNQSKPLDKEKIGAKKQEINSLRDQLSEKTKAMNEEIGKVYTPEQLQQIDKFKIARGKRYQSKNIHFKRWGNNRRNGFEYYGFFSKNLKLTTEQQQNLLAIQKQHYLNTIDLRFDIQLKNLELKELWSNKPLNQKDIEQKSKKVAGLRVQYANKVQEMKEQIKSILTEEQQKKLDERMTRKNVYRVRIRRNK